MGKVEGQGRFVDFPSITSFGHDVSVESGEAELYNSKEMFQSKLPIAE